MDVARKPNPALERKRITRKLTRIRQSKKLTQHEVAAKLRWSQSKVTRIEGGDVGLSHTDLLALLNLYEVHDQETIEALVEMAANARRPSLPRFAEAHSKQFRQYLENETYADSLLEFENSYIPGLLQIPSYAEALLRTINRFSSLSRTERAEAEEDLRKKVEVRRWRQQVFDEGGIEMTSFVLDESVIRRQVGTELDDRRLMIEQLEHLKEMNRHPRVDIRVVPFSAGAHLGMSGPFVVLHFPDENDPSLLYLEYATGEFVTKEESELTQRFASAFEALQAQGRRGRDLDALLDDAISAMR